MSVLELPVIYKYHVFTCFAQRPHGHPKGSCVASGCQPLWDRLQEKIDNDELQDVCLTVSGCLSFCRAGPLMVVYPEGIWYHPERLDDIDEIIQSHFIDGHPVERLIIVPQR